MERLVRPQLSVYGGANLNATGTGIIGQGNNVVPTYLAAGQGGAFTGLGTGIYAGSTTNGIGQSIYTSQFGNIVRVNYWDGVTQWKIQGAGTMPVACAVKDLNGQMRALYCPESPNFKFEDQGQVQLNNGQVHVIIDPILANNIVVDGGHFMHVTITPQGDCNQLYVTNITNNGFDVVESNGGTSTIVCTYELKAFVKDWDMGNGRVSTFPRFSFIAPNDEVGEIKKMSDTKE